MAEQPFPVAIFTYTRAQAIADGTLVDLTEWAGPQGMLGGFTLPLAVTAAVWADIQAIPGRLEGLADARGRAHDVLWLAVCAARRNPNGDRVRFQVILPVAGARRRIREYVLVCGPGDDGEPVLTIMREGED